MNPTYYQQLGVARTATQPEIKAAFKSLAVKFHPDKHGGSREYEHRFKQINEAYQVLSDPRKKQLYDLKLYYASSHTGNFGATSPYHAANMYRQNPGQQHYTQPPRNNQYYSSPPPPPPRPAAPRKPAPKPPERTWRDYGLVFLIMICLAGFGLVLKYTMDHITAVDNYETAVEYIGQHRYSEAHGLLTEAIGFKPGYGEAFMKKGDLELLVYKNASAALYSYNRAFATMQRVPVHGYYMRAKCYLETGDLERAEKDLVQVVRMDSTIATASLELGVIRLHNLGKVDASVQDFTRFINYATDSTQVAQAYQLRGYARYLTGSLGKSQQDLQQSIRIDSKNPVTYGILADLKLAMRDTSSACSYFAIAYNLGDRTAESSLSRYCGRFGDRF